MFTSCLAPRCLHDTCYIVRVRKNRQKQLASGTHVQTSVKWLEDRLSSLALIHIHYQMEIDLDEVVAIFSVKEPRRMQLTNTCILRD